MNKKGFTLLELLAVIVVLAIVTLIAIPIIANVIEKSKEGSASDSAYGYIDTIEKSVALGALDPEKGISIPADNTLSMDDIDDAVILESIKLKGTKPDYVELTFERSKVKSGGFCIDGYNFEYKNKKIEKSSTNYCALASVERIELLETNNPDVINDNGEYYLNLSPGTTYQLNPTVVSSETGIPVKYKVDSGSIATVSNSGLVSAVVTGSTRLFLHAGTKTIIVNVSVMKPSLVSTLRDKRYPQEDNTDSITIEDITYNLHVYYYNGNQTWTANKTFGSADDVASGPSPENMAKKMVVVIVNGDLTINSGVTVSPYYDTKYGGPKGFALIVTGKLTNNGIIDNSHGAYATGEKVYLWYNANHTNENDEYEFVPAVGGSGATAANPTSGGTNNIFYSNGQAGKASTVKRGTAGGGGGAARKYQCCYKTNNTKGGAGGAGTSYSGGAGGGAVSNANSETTTVTGIAGSSTGGGGGNANILSSGSSTIIAGGGAGNPGGSYKTYKATASTVISALNGTGGLLIIYGNEIINGASGKITALGSRGGGQSDKNGSAYNGGSSGGGSINIFYKDSFTNNNTSGISAKGAAGYDGKRTGTTGGAGGNGSVVIGSVATGTFVENT